jgi:hypothetical protein
VIFPIEHDVRCDAEQPSSDALGLRPLELDIKESFRKSLRTYKWGILMTMKAKLAVLATCVFALLGLTGCSGGVDGTDGFEEEYGSVENAQVVCTLAAPVVTEVREENPGPVAAGVTKIYHVQVRNANSTGCAPATLTFIPDSFMFFSIQVQPQTIAGVSSGSTASFRVAVTSDQSLPEGVTDIGFTVVANNPTGGATSVRGSLRYEIDFDNPTGCNRQLPQIEIAIVSPTPVPRGGTINYNVTVRNVDNRECGPDTFSLGFDFARFFSIGVTPTQITIPAGSSATFAVTVSSEPTFIGPGVHQLPFNVFGQRHVNAGLIARGSLRYEVR